MSLNEDLRNCRIVIRDVDAGKTLVDSTILAYAAERDSIEVETDRIVLPEGAKVSALIFSNSGIFESQGTVGEKDGKKTTIVLYEGTDRDERKAVRYLVNIHGDVDRINRPGEGKILVNFGVTVLNMSSIGLLLQAPEGQVKESDVIHFYATSKGQRIAITAVAARMGEVESGKEKIGCSIQLVNLG